MCISCYVSQDFGTHPHIFFIYKDISNLSILLHLILLYDKVFFTFKSHISLVPDSTAYVSNASLLEGL